MLGFCFRCSPPDAVRPAGRARAASVIRLSDPSGGAAQPCHRRSFRRAQIDRPVKHTIRKCPRKGGGNSLSRNAPSSAPLLLYQIVVPAKAGTHPSAPETLEGGSRPAPGSRPGKAGGAEERRAVLSSIYRASNSLTAVSIKAASSGLSAGLPARWPQIDGIGRSSARGMRATSRRLSSTVK